MPPHTTARAGHCRRASFQNAAPATSHRWSTGRSRRRCDRRSRPEAYAPVCPPPWLALCHRRSDRRTEAGIRGCAASGIWARDQIRPSLHRTERQAARHRLLRAHDLVRRGYGPAPPGAVRSAFRRSAERRHGFPAITLTPEPAGTKAAASADRSPPRRAFGPASEARSEASRRSRSWRRRLPYRPRPRPDAPRGPL